MSQKKSNNIRQNVSNEQEFQLLQHWLEEIGFKGKKKENIPRYAAVSAVAALRLYGLLLTTNQILRLS